MPLLKSKDLSALTPNEIVLLPLELRIAYAIQPWTHNANIKTIDDWIDGFYYLFYDDFEVQTPEDCKAKLRKRFAEHYWFTVNYLIKPSNT